MSEHRDFRSMAKQLERIEVCMHELMRRDDTVQVDLDELLAARSIASSCWEIVRLHCERARIELPNEPDWLSI